MAGTNGEKTGKGTRKGGGPRRNNRAYTVCKCGNWLYRDRISADTACNRCGLMFLAPSDADRGQGGKKQVAGGKAQVAPDVLHEYKQAVAAGESRTAAVLEKLHPALSAHKAGNAVAAGEKTPWQRLAEARGKMVVCDRAVKSACDQVIKAEAQVASLGEKVVQKMAEQKRASEEHTAAAAAYNLHRQAKGRDDDDSDAEVHPSASAACVETNACVDKLADIILADGAEHGNAAHVVHDMLLAQLLSKHRPAPGAKRGADNINALETAEAMDYGEFAGFGEPPDSRDEIISNGAFTAASGEAASVPASSVGTAPSSQATTVQVGTVATAEPAADQQQEPNAEEQEERRRLLQEELRPLADALDPRSRK